MTQITADSASHPHDDPSSDPRLSADNISLAPTAANGLSNLLVGIGVAGLVLCAVGGFVYGTRHALAAYQVGVMACLAMTLGGFFLTLLHHLLNAGWSVTIRRQAENIATQMPLMAVLVAVFVAIEVINGGVLLRWMYEDNFLTQHKRGYLNVPFFVVRALLILGLWLFITTRLRAFSTEQDRTGDRWLSVNMRRTATWGMLVFALSVAFGAFDWLMSMDYRFFSTMWGVYYFAGAAYSGTALLILVLAVLRGVGRLTGVVTAEHFHDLGKLLFAFTVFWAYIGFSQYFLIWYSNIPEETAYMVHRSTGDYKALFLLLAFGHFLVPFMILMIRDVKKSTVGLCIFACWALLMQFIDMQWIVRPMVYAGLPPEANPGPIAWWVDIAGPLGVFSLYLGVLARRVVAGPLIPIRDPRLAESLHHKNYV